MGKNNDNNHIKRQPNKLNTFIKDYILLIVIIILIIVFSSINPAFIFIENIFYIIKQASILGFIALGLCLIVIIGEFDISLAAIPNFVAVVTIVLIKYDVSNTYILWTLGILTAIILSMVNSIFVVHIGVPSFIVTLGTQFSLTALSRALTMGGQVVHPPFIPAGFSVLGQGFLFSVIPVAVVIFLVGAAIILGIVEYTPFGRKLYAVGSDPDACNHVGIKVKSTKMKAFFITGVLYGIAGILMSSMFNSCSAAMGTVYLFPGIISVFLGATFLSTGYSNIRGTIVSAFFLSALVNGFATIGMPFFLRSIIQGLILLGAIGYQKFGKGKYEISTKV